MKYKKNQDGESVYRTYEVNWKEQLELGKNEEVQDTYIDDDVVFITTNEER